MVKPEVKAEVDAECGPKFVVNGGNCGCEEDKPLQQRVSEAFCDKDAKCATDCSWCLAKKDVEQKSRDTVCSAHKLGAACTADTGCVVEKAEEAKTDTAEAKDAVCKAIKFDALEAICVAFTDAAACGGNTHCDFKGDKCIVKKL